MSLEYILPSEAYELAGRRLRDNVLQNRVAAYLGNVWPRGFEEPDEPAAVYAPYLAKGSETEIAALRIARKSGFTTAIATYTDAEYVTANPGLVDCYRAPLKLPRNQRVRQWVVDDAYQSGVVGTAPTIYSGLSIVGYWQGLRRPVLEESRLPTNDRVVDFSRWYTLQARRFGWNGERSRSSFYYRAAMALYASGRAVLFDTPPTAFADRVMAPAYAAACEAFGVEPLLTNELRPEKRDWTNLNFLDETEVKRLQITGRIRS